MNKCPEIEIVPADFFYILFVSLQFENEIITKLDHEVEGGRGDEQYKILFQKM